MSLDRLYICPQSVKILTTSIIIEEYRRIKIGNIRLKGVTRKEGIIVQKTAQTLSCEISNDACERVRTLPKVLKQKEEKEEE